MKTLLRFSLRVKHPEQWAKLKKYADDNDLSMNQLLNRLIKEWSDSI